MEKEIIQVLKYFKYFKYSPNFDEVYAFIKTKTSKERLDIVLKNLVKKGVIASKKIDYSIIKKITGVNTEYRYTLGEYSIKTKNLLEKIKYSIEKIQKVENYINLLSFFPQIQLIGLSGTVSMSNASEKDDIDLFIITAKNRLWTARMICLYLAILFGLRRKRNTKSAQDKVCLNLFFDKSNLRVPKNKQTDYVAHEVLQMKPLINKNLTYEQFLEKNNWVFNIFPNTKPMSLKHKLLNNKLPRPVSLVFDWIEVMLKKLQLALVNQHRTNEIITDDQLWFFPEDFEKKILTNNRL